MDSSEELVDTSSDQTEYNPNRLLDTIIDNLRLRNDAQLCRVLEVAHPMISKIRHGHIPVGAAMLIRMHEATGLSIRDLRYLMGDRRKKFRISAVQSRDGSIQGYAEHVP